MSNSNSRLNFTIVANPLCLFIVGGPKITITATAWRSWKQNIKIMAKVSKIDVISQQIKIQYTLKTVFYSSL